LQGFYTILERLTTFRPPRGTHCDLSPQCQEWRSQVRAPHSCAGCGSLRPREDENGDRCGKHPPNLPSPPPAHAAPWQPTPMPTPRPASPPSSPTRASSPRRRPAARTRTAPTCAPASRRPTAARCARRRQISTGRDASRSCCRAAGRDAATRSLASRRAIAAGNAPTARITDPVVG